MVQVSHGADGGIIHGDGEAGGTELLMVFTRMLLERARPQGLTVVESVKTLESWMAAQPAQ